MGDVRGCVEPSRVKMRAVSIDERPRLGDKWENYKLQRESIDGIVPNGCYGGTRKARHKGGANFVGMAYLRPLCQQYPFLQVLYNYMWRKLI